MNFTPRETDILRLVALGNSDKEIAHLLGLAETTIGTYIHRLFNKAGVRSRVRLVGVALANGVVSLSEVKGMGRV